ncbi:trithorax group protein osa isoform X1 [Biomphalaria glabrata]|nr:trithorax group protein osa isoform X1 [Biomphalaria glabrata]
MEWESQRPSAPSTPSSMSSQSTSNSTVRNDKIPALKQISPSPSVSTLSKLTDDELRRKGIEDLIRILRRIEGDYKTLLSEHGNIVKDVNRRFQIFVLELRGLKEVNQKLQDDNQELRDLCCFLDDDRQRGRKLAREWQRFGRYTASVMRSEVAVYQEKLRELESRQTELITENVELKELCLFLDQERLRMTGDRDEGDGSSNGTIAGHEDGVVAMDTNGSTTPTPGISSSNTYSTSGSVANYIRELELKVQRLEEEKNLLTQRVDFIGPDWRHASSEVGNMAVSNNDPLLHGSVPGHVKSSVSNKPEAVVHAMKVLQVHEELEKIPYQDEDLDDPEKAIVREMCNVVWRKLGDVEDVGAFNETSESFLDPPYTLTSQEKANVAPGQKTHQQQPQMASTPLTAAMKSGTSNQIPYYPNPTRPPERQPPPEQLSSHSYLQNQTETAHRARVDHGNSQHFHEEQKIQEKYYSSNMPLDSKNKSASQFYPPNPPHYSTSQPSLPRYQDVNKFPTQHVSDPISRIPHHPASSKNLNKSVDPGHWNANHGDASNAAPMQRNQNAQMQEPFNYSRYGGGDSIDNYEKQSALHQKMGMKSENIRDEFGGYYSSSNTQTIVENFSTDNRSSSEKEGQIKVSSRSYSSSSALNQPVPQSSKMTSASQLNLRGPAGFRAYPPQLTSMPTQPIAWQGSARPPDIGRSNYAQEPPARAAPYLSEPMPQTSVPTMQARGVTTKKFQEQEWRQTYLDDSDTL